MDARGVAVLVELLAEVGGAIAELMRLAVDNLGLPAAAEVRREKANRSERPRRRLHDGGIGGPSPGGGRGEAGAGEPAGAPPNQEPRSATLRSVSMCLRRICNLPPTR